MSAGGIPTPLPLPTLRATMPPLPPHPAPQPPSAPGLSLESGGSAPLPGLRATIPPPAMPPAAGAPSPPAGAAAPEPDPPPIMMPAQPAGDPQAARRLAAAYRDAADALARTELTGTWTLGTLGGLWSGPARDAADVPLDALARQARTLAAGLTETADQLETYARRLEDAQHDHAMSVAKLVTLGVVVGVTVGAVVVTMGAGRGWHRGGGHCRRGRGDRSRRRGCRGRSRSRRRAGVLLRPVDGCARVHRVGAAARGRSRVQRRHHSFHGSVDNRADQRSRHRRGGRARLRRQRRELPGAGCAGKVPVVGRSLRRPPSRDDQVRSWRPAANQPGRRWSATGRWAHAPNTKAATSSTAVTVANVSPPASGVRSLRKAAGTRGSTRVLYA
jgi:hypothetical protein